MLLNIDRTACKLKQIAESRWTGHAEAEEKFLMGLKNDPEKAKEFVKFALPKLPEGVGDGGFQSFTKMYSRPAFGFAKTFNSDTVDGLLAEIEEKPDLAFPVAVRILIGWLNEEEAESLMKAFEKQPASEAVEAPVPETPVLPETPVPERVPETPAADLSDLPPEGQTGEIFNQKELEQLGQYPVDNIMPPDEFDTEEPVDPYDGFDTDYAPRTEIPGAFPGDFPEDELMPEFDQKEIYGEAEDSKIKYTADSSIETVDDVKDFFTYLADDLKLNFHPDDNLAHEFQDVLSRKDGEVLDKLMDKCFEVCDSDGVDIYGLAYDILEPTRAEAAMFED